LNKERLVVNSICSCKAGLVVCKHKAAVFVAINDDSGDTITSQTQTWGKKAKISAKYNGIKMCDLFPKQSQVPPHLSNMAIDTNKLLKELEAKIDTNKCMYLKNYDYYK
jgi:hypothetical protein